MKQILSLLCLFVALAGATSALAGPVNVNTADAATLAAELTGVGKATAQAIVAYREQHGPFRSAADLQKVKGIGARLIDRNRANIRVADEETDRQ